MDEPPPLPTRAQAEERLQSVRRRAGRRAKKERKNVLRNASNWVLAITVLQLAFGLVFGLGTKLQSDRALAKLATQDDDALFDVAGQSVTTVELRRMVQQESVQAFVLPMGLGVVFLVLYFWARKAPLPALATALALYVTVQMISIVLVPSQLMSFLGTALKIMCIAALARGVKAALQERAIQQAAAGAT